MTEDVQPDEPQKPPPSFGDVARTIRGRTTDLLAIAIVIIGGLTVGSRVSQWWDNGEDDGTPGRKPAAGTPQLTLDETEPVTLDFGRSPYRIERTVIHGGRKQAGERLVGSCRRSAETAPLPASPVTAAERRMLAALAEQKPLLEQPGRWKLYRFDGPLITVTAIRSVPAEPPSGRCAAAGPHRRVVCWGVAFPSGEERWVMYKFLAGESDAATQQLPAIPLPKDVKPLLTVRGGRNAWQTFHSAAPPATVRKFYEQWFAANGWKQTSATDNDWTAVFVKDTDDGQLRAEIQISANAPRGCTGVVFVTRIKSN